MSGPRPPEPGSGERDRDGSEPGTASYPASPQSQPPQSQPPPSTRPADPERGLRGVMSGMLILETVTILLGLTVLGKGDTDASTSAVVLVCVLAAAHIAACVVIAKPYATATILVLQTLVIACWAVAPSLGIVGIVFALAWIAVLWMRREFRRRLADGRIPGQDQ